MTTDNRRFSRIHFDSEVVLARDGKQWNTTLLDVSLNGLLAIAPPGWNAVPGELFKFDIVFANGDNLVRGEAKVAHVGQGRAGFHMTAIDVDSVAHMRRLVELNLGDETLLDRELSALHWK